MYIRRKGAYGPIRLTVLGFATAGLMLSSAGCGGGGSARCVSGSGGAVTNSWQQVNTPASATKIHYFSVNSSNHWFTADRVNGFYKSTDQGNSWSQINNSGINTSAWTIDYDLLHGQLIAGTFGNGVQFWRSSDEGTTWTQLTTPRLLSWSDVPAYSGVLVSPSGTIVDGAFWSAGNLSCGSWYSNDGGSTTNVINFTLLPGGSTNGCGGAWSFLYNPVTKDYWMGTEIEGVLRSTDAVNWTQVMAYHCPYASTCIPGNGNVDGMSYDSTGNILAGAQAGIYKSSGSAGSYTWNLAWPSNGAIRTVFRDPAGTLYYGQQNTSSLGSPDRNAVYRSTDQGVTFQAFSSNIPPSSTGANLEAWHFMINPSDNNLYVNLQDEATNNGWVYRTLVPQNSGVRCTSASAP